MVNLSYLLIVNPLDYTIYSYIRDYDLLYVVIIPISGIIY